MKKYIDARNLPNPQPLVYTKRALADGEFSYLIVHVNNKTAKENVVRFAQHAGFPVEKTDEHGGEFFITIANTEELPPTVEPPHYREAETGEEEAAPSEGEEPSAEQGGGIFTAEPGEGAAESGAERGTDSEPSPARLFAGSGSGSGSAASRSRGAARTLLLGTGAMVSGNAEGGISVSPFLDRFLRSLTEVPSALRQIILTDGAALLAVPESEYLSLFLTLRRRGVAIYCDQESCDEWNAVPSPEAVTLIDSRSMTEKLLNHSPVLSL